MKLLEVTKASVALHCGFVLLSEKPFHAAALVMSKWLLVSVLAISLLCRTCLAGDLCVLGGVSAQGLLLVFYLSACPTAYLPP